MNDYAVSIIRTVVPSAVAWALTSLAVWVGPVPDDLATQVTVGITGLCVLVYYSAVRWLERRWPWVGRFGLGLGIRAAEVQPSYAPGPEPIVTGAEVADE